MNIFLKKAGVKTEQEFYNKYPTEDHFFNAHPDMLHMRDGGGVNKKYTPKMLSGGIAGFDPKLAMKQAEQYDALKKTKLGGAASLTNFGFGQVGDILNANTAYQNSDVAPEQTAVNVGKSTGSLALGGAGKGAAAGAVLGPIGAGVGAAIGLVGGLLTGGIERKREKKEQMQLDSVAKTKYEKLNLSANLDPYGTGNSFYAKKGGMIKKMMEGGVGDPAGFTDIMSRPERPKPVNDITMPTKEMIRKDPTFYNPIMNTGNFGYQGVDGINGTFSEYQAIRNYLNYMTNNASDQSDHPSNVYRLKNEHLAVNEKSLSNVPVAADGGIINPQLNHKPNLNLPPYQQAAPTALYPHIEGNDFGIRAGLFGQQKINNRLSVNGNIDLPISAYGIQKPQVQLGMAYRFEDGGAPDEQEASGNPQESEQQEGLQMTMVDIEKGELLIDPVTLEILREYENPNRYKKHAKNPQFEPIGNFTNIEEGKVVISNEFSAKFKAGDTLTKKSIVLQILKNQRNNPTPTVSDVQDTPKADDGLMVKRRGPKPPLRSAMNSPLNDVYALSNSWMPGVTKMNVTGDMNPPEPIQPESLTPAGQTALYSSQRAPTGGNDPFTPAALDRKDEPGRKGITATDVARGLNFIPTGYGLAKALKFQPEAYDENIQIENAKAYAQGMETNPSIEAARANLNTTIAGRNRALTNINSPSVRAEAAAGNADLLNTEGNLIQGANNFALDARNKKRETLSNLNIQQGQSRYQAREALKDNIMKNQANSRTMIQQGLSEGVRNYGAQVMDDNALRAFNTELHYQKINNDGSVTDTKEFGKSIADIMSSGKGFSMDDLNLAYKEYTKRKDSNGRAKGYTEKERYTPKNNRT